MAKNDKPEKNVNNKKQKTFWKDFKAELKKVIWPTRSQVVNNTIIVLVIVLIVTALCFVLDLAFEALNTYGIDNLKSMVQNSVSNTENTADSDETNTVDDNAENTVDVETENIVNEDEANAENSESTNTENNENADETNNNEAGEGEVAE